MILNYYINLVQALGIAHGTSLRIIKLLYSSVFLIPSSIAIHPSALLYIDHIYSLQPTTRLLNTLKHTTAIANSFILSLNTLSPLLLLLLPPIPIPPPRLSPFAVPTHCAPGTTSQTPSHSSCCRLRSMIRRTSPSLLAQKLRSVLRMQLRCGQGRPRTWRSTSQATLRRTEVSVAR